MLKYLVGSLVAAAFALSANAQDLSKLDTSLNKVPADAAFYSEQKPKEGTARNAATVKVGEKIYRAGIAEKGVAACAGCHGPVGSGIPAQYPRLAGQWADYTKAQLTGFRVGERANDPNGMMRGVASRMSDKEIEAVADYIAGLKSAD